MGRTGRSGALDWSSSMRFDAMVRSRPHNLLSRIAARRWRLSVVAAAAAAVVIAGCGGGGSSNARSAASVESPKESLHGAVANPPFQARDLVLNDSLGHRVDLAQYRGKAVLVTFIYTHCPDVCPLIVGNLHTAQNQLGAAAKKLQIVAVSVDPKGDTPKTVAAFLKAHQMTGRMEYLIGSRSQLERVWRRWGILAKADPSSPDAVEHSALIYGIAASGKVLTLYPANFKPAWIVQDVPKLAGQ
jgi:protein SCO1